MSKRIIIIEIKRVIEMYINIYANIGGGGDGNVER